MTKEELIPVSFACLTLLLCLPWFPRDCLPESWESLGILRSRSWPISTVFSRVDLWPWHGRSVEKLDAVWRDKLRMLADLTPLRAHCCPIRSLRGQRVSIFFPPIYLFPCHRFLATIPSYIQQRVMIPAHATWEQIHVPPRVISSILTREWFPVYCARVAD